MVQNQTKRALQLTACIFMIVTGAFELLFSLLFIIVAATRGLEDSVTGQMLPAPPGAYVAFALIGLIGVAVVVVASLFCRRKNYFNKGLAIATLVLSIFTSIVAFILMIIFLCLRDDNQPDIQQNAEDRKLAEDDIVELLAKYKKLLDDGVITKREFFIKKQEILGIEGSEYAEEPAVETNKFAEEQKPQNSEAAAPKKARSPKKTNKDNV